MILIMCRDWWWSDKHLCLSVGHHHSSHCRQLVKSDKCALIGVILHTNWWTHAVPELCMRSEQGRGIVILLPDAPPGVGLLLVVEALIVFKPYMYSGTFEYLYMYQVYYTECPCKLCVTQCHKHLNCICRNLIHFRQSTDLQPPTSRHSST